MGQGWQDKIRRYEQKQAEKQRAKEEAERARQEAQWKAEEAREAAEYQRKLAKHQRRFYCHICGFPSEGPQKREVTRKNPGPHTDFYSRAPYSVTVIDWDIPTGLDICKFCKKRVCYGCSYNDICRRCGERL